MATSNQYTFNPSLGSLTIFAFNRVGVRASALTQEYLEDARMAAGMILMDWSNKGVNLWEVQLFTVPFVKGQASYSVPANLVNILDLYYTVASGTSYTNRYITPVSRTEFASYPNPNQQGITTTYWHNRTFNPTLNFYLTPDGTEQSFSYYALVQLQDANFTSGQTVDIVPLWLTAFAYALAVHLIPWSDRADRAELRASLPGMADRFYASAAATNVETSQIYITPTLEGYWRT